MENKFIDGDRRLGVQFKLTALIIYNILYKNNLI